MPNFVETRYGWGTAERYADDLSFPYVSTAIAGPALSCASSTSAVSVMLPAAWRGKYISICAAGCDTRIRLDSNKGVSIATTESAIAASDLDADGLITSTASPTTGTTYTTNSGVVTRALLKTTPRHITFTVSNHANWDATTAYIYGKTDGGVAVSEALVIPDSGNTTLTTRFIYSEWYALFIPTQSGASGTFTLGVADSLTRTIAGTEPHYFIPAGGVLHVRLQNDAPGETAPTNPPAAASGYPGHHWLTHIDSATGGFLHVALATGVQP